MVRENRMGFIRCFSWFIAKTFILKRGGINMLSIYLMYAIFNYQPATITTYPLAGNAVMKVYEVQDKIIRVEMKIN